MGFGSIGGNSGGNATTKGIVYKGTFAGSNNYSVDEMVTYGNGIYRCMSDITRVGGSIVQILPLGTITAITPTYLNPTSGTEMASDGSFYNYCFDTGVSAYQGGIEIAFSAMRSFRSCVFYDTTAFAGYGFDKLSGIKVFVDDVEITSSAAYDSANKKYTISFSEIFGKKIKFLFGSAAGAAMCSEIKLYGSDAIYPAPPTEDTTHWSLFAANFMPYTKAEVDALVAK